MDKLRALKSIAVFKKPNCSNYGTPKFVRFARKIGRKTRNLAPFDLRKDILGPKNAAESNFHVEIG